MLVGLELEGGEGAKIAVTLDKVLTILGSLLSAVVRLPGPCTWVRVLLLSVA